MKLKLFLYGLCLFLTTNMVAQSPIGIWKTIDDNSGEARSHVEIYQQNGKYYGKIVRLLKSDPETLCDKCPGAKKNKPVLNLVIIEKLSAKSDYWANGTILDPESGKEYGCSIWLEKGNANQLNVRGKHWTGFYRTQTWYRVQ